MEAEWRTANLTVLAKLPTDALPQSSRHGKYSYTVRFGQAAIEVLIKQAAFHVKATVAGKYPDPPRHFAWSKHQSLSDAWQAAKRTAELHVD